MGRAQGRNTPPRGILGRLIDPDETLDEKQARSGHIRPEADRPGPGDERPQAAPLQEEEGAGQASQGRGWERGIPGGKNHLANTPVQRQPVPVPASEWPYYQGLLAHGVPPEGHMHTRDPRLHGIQSRVQPEHLGQPPSPEPVPVYIVEQAGGPKPRALTGTKRMTLPAAGSEAVQIVSEDAGRSLIQLLNEDSTHHARIGQLGDLAYDAQNGVIVGGSRLPANATSYVVIRTQGPLWAVSETSSTVAISVLTEFQIADAG